MKKLLVSASIMAALGLSGCGGETISDLQADTEVQSPVSRVVFDPANGNLNIPNDLLMLPSEDGVFDFTLNIPVDDASDFSDPQNALNTQDGWSTNYPFQINVDVPSDRSLDASTLSAGIKIYEATLGLDVSDPDCLAVAIPSAGCKVGDELVFGVDYILSLSGSDTISVVPLQPLKSAQGYMLVVTDALKDDQGNGVEGSTTWDLVKQDIASLPLSSDSQLQLQTLVNTYIDALADVGLSRDEISYVQVFTTVSSESIMNTVKQLHIAPFAQTLALSPENAAAALPAVTVTNIADTTNAMETLGLVNDALISASITGAIANNAALQALQGVIDITDFTSLSTCSGLLASAGGFFTTTTGQDFGSAEVNAGIDALAQGVSTGVLSQVGALCAANVLEGNINLPYYSAMPSVENPLAPISEFWEAACTSGIVLASASDTSFTEFGPNQTLCSAAGLADVRVNGEKIDPDRRITKFSPIPQANGSNSGTESLDVQITIPSPEVAAALGFTISMPEAGWPVAILSHGITSQKEDMLAITGALSLAGFATVAIDQPIHGSRGFDLDGDGTDELNATTVSATHYLNLSSLPTARDNLRQSVSDLLGLRLGLNAVIDASETGLVNLDASNVSLMGVSLGALTGGMFTSIANTPLEGDLAVLSDMFSIQAASLESPGSGIATFLLESPSFGPLIKGFLMAEASTDFQAFLVSSFGTTDVSEEQLVSASNSFLAILDEAQSAEINSVFTQFAFAAQTLLDAADPISYFATLNSNTNVHMLSVVGDGGETNLPDQVIPISSSLPLAGQLALASIMGLEQVVSTTSSDSGVSGIVQFSEGAHASSLSPTASAATTAEMQTQVATYFATGGSTILISNQEVISNN